VGSVLLLILVFCVPLLCVFTFWVPCCDVRYDFRIQTLFALSLPPVVCRRAHVLEKAIEIITKFLLQGGVICLPNGRHTNKYRCIAIINKTKADVNVVTWQATRKSLQNIGLVNVICIVSRTMIGDLQCCFYADLRVWYYHNLCTVRYGSEKNLQTTEKVF
jgi:hypothetical protein